MNAKVEVEERKEEGDEDAADTEAGAVETARDADADADDADTESDHRYSVTPEDATTEVGMEGLYILAFVAVAAADID